VSSQVGSTVLRARSEMQVTPPSSIRVACCQLHPQLDVADSNERQTRNAIRGAIEAGARLIVLPELCTTGYAFETETHARSAAEASRGTVDGWVEEAAGGDVVVVGGFAELDPDGNLFNSAAVVDGSGVLSIYRKTHLWGTERAMFKAGDAIPPVVDTEVGRIGVGICYDLFFPEVTRGLALRGAEIIVVPTNAPRGPNAGSVHDNIGVSIARAAAHVNRVFVAVCDRWGAERGVQWVGRSLIADPEGDLVAAPPGDREQLLVADCELIRAHDKRWSGTSNDAFRDRRPDHYEWE